MGVKESAAIRARQREVAARIDRLIEQADNRAPIASHRRDQIRASARQGRAALRRRARANREADQALADVGHVLTRLVDLGLKNFEAFDALGLSIGVGRRLLLEARALHDNPPTQGDI